MPDVDKQLDTFTQYMLFLLFHSFYFNWFIKLSDCDLSFHRVPIPIYLHLYVGANLFFFMHPNSYASVVLEDLFGSRKELIDLDSIGKLRTFLLCFSTCILVLVQQFNCV